MRNNLSQIETIPQRLSGRSFHRKPLEREGKKLEEIQSLYDQADTFFFDEDGLRSILSLDRTTEIIAHLLEQDVFTSYCVGRQFCSIPTHESIRAVTDIISNLGVQNPIEIGAGDGLLASGIYKAGVSSIRAFDNNTYGNILEPTQGYLDRPAHDIVENLNANDALYQLSPDFVISSWLINPMLFPNLEVPEEYVTDAHVLQTESVQHYLWIGETTKRMTSSPNMWKVPGWRQTRMHSLEKLFFCKLDSIHEYLGQLAYPKNMPVERIRSNIDRETMIVLFSRD